MAKGASNNTLLYAGIGGGVLLLLSCCCVGGIGGWFFFLRTPSDDKTAGKTNKEKEGPPPLEKQIVGKWGMDMDEMRKANPEAAKFLEGFKVDTMSVEFKNDGTYVMRMADQSKTSKWEVVSTKAEVLTIKTQPLDAKDKSKRLEIRAIDSNHLKVTDTEIPEGKSSMGRETYLKRL
jgi:hypothetical protein